MNILDENGTKVVVYGGWLSTGVIVGELWVLDVVASTWTQGISGPPRTGAACTIAGDQFLVWGGHAEQDMGAAPQMLLYNLLSSKYIDRYTPPAYYKDRKPPPALTRTGSLPIPTFDVDAKKDQPSSNRDLGRLSVPVKVTIGGAVGGLVLLGTIVAFFLIRQRRRRRQGHSSKDRRFMDKNTGASGRLGGLLRRVRGDRSGSYKVLKKDPQGTNEDDQLEQTLLELQDQEQQLEDQRKELDQKRQLLVLQHRESNPRLPTDQKRGPIAFMDDKAKFFPLLPPSPLRFSPSAVYSVVYSAENLNDRRTVQAVSGPVDMYQREDYVDDSPRRESELAQDVIEPMYGPSPTVSNSIPDLVYEPSPDVGMDWTKQQQGNHPHALIDPSFTVIQE